MDDKPHPVFLELKTYRISGHSRGDACDYRSREEEAVWAQKDPLLLARETLSATVGWDDAREDAVIARAEAIVADAERFAFESASEAS